MNNGKVKPMVLSVSEARKQLGLGKSLMYSAVKSGQIPSIRIGRRILIPQVALDSLLSGAVVARGEKIPESGEMNS
ncbi:helix-turn-helix domain-containing protein [Chloroflexota bacterium]